MPFQHGPTDGITHSIIIHGDTRDGQWACRGGILIIVTGEWDIITMIHSFIRRITHIGTDLTIIIPTITEEEDIIAESVQNRQIVPSIQV